MKKRFGLWIAIALTISVLVGLVGCAGANEGENAGAPDSAPEASRSGEESATASDVEISRDRETVEFWYLWGGDEEKAILEAIDLYNSSQDKYFVKGTMCDMQKQTAGMAGTSGPDITDIIDVNVSGLASSGAVENLTPYIERDGFDTSEFNNAAMQLCEYEGELYGLPLNAMSNMVYYNKAALDEAGITELPETMEELMDVAIKLTKFDEEGNIIQLGWPWINDPTPVDFLTLANNFGATWISEDGQTITCDEEAVIAAYQYMLEYMDAVGKEKVQQFIASYGTAKSTSEDPLFTGKQALRIDGMYLTNLITSNGYNLDDFGVFGLPYWEERPELEGIQTITSSIFIIPKNANNKEGAWDFIKWIHSDEGMTFIDSRFQNEASRSSLINNEELKAANPLYEEFIESGAKNPVPRFPSVKNSDTYINELNSATDAVFNGSSTPEEAMRQVKEKMNSLIK